MMPRKKPINPLPSMQASSCAPSYGKVTDDLKDALSSVVGRENLSSSLAVREHHGRDESYHACLPADVVVFPSSVDHVSQVARLCHNHHIPLVPFGTGTGLEGGVGAVHVRTNAQPYSTPMHQPPYSNTSIHPYTHTSMHPILFCPHQSQQ